MGVLKDLTGQQFDRLRVLGRAAEDYVAPPSYTSRKIHKAVRWICRCDCGRQVEVTGINLKQGKTRSCGCLRSEKSAENIKKAREKIKHRGRKHK